MRRFIGVLMVGLALGAGAGPGRAADEKPKQEGPAYSRTRDVIYGRKFGLALTLDVFTPKKANGAGVIFVVSSGWFSRPEGIQPILFREFLRRGYTVFAVVHGSQPKFTLPEIVEDMHRAVRFIRCHAKDYAIDPERIGITGASAGGHLALMQGTAGEAGDPKAKDPVERVSSRVQAVACFFPPTDFLNWGAEGRELLGRSSFQPPFCAAADYHEFDKTKCLYLPVTDQKTLREISRRVSPIYHVSSDDPPTLILHGDKDQLVPLQQSESMAAKLKGAGVPVELIVKKGARHGWPTVLADMKAVADWFDKYLGKGRAKAEK